MKKIKKMISLVIVAFILSLIPVQNMLAATVNLSGINWSVVDHTNWSNVVGDNDYNIGSPVSASAGQLVTYYNDVERGPAGFLNPDGYGMILERHVLISPDGNQLTFTGYGSPAFHDFLFVPNTVADEKVFKFSVNETAASYHSLQAYGFVFNASYETSDLNSRKLSGYYVGITNSFINLYQLTQVDVSGLNGLDTSKHIYLPTSVGASEGGFELVAQADKSLFQTTTLDSAEMRYFTIVTTKDSVVISQFTDVTFATLVNGKPILNQSNLTDSGTYGFGPYVAYDSHNCSDITRIVITDLSFSSPSLASNSEPVTPEKIELEPADTEPETTRQINDDRIMIAVPEQKSIPKTGEQSVLILGIGLMMAGAVLWLFLRRYRLNNDSI